MFSPPGVAVMRILRYAGFTLLALFFVVPSLGLLQSSSTSMEETSILQYASMVSDGHVPTKDFWTEYGPLNTYAPAAVFSVVGPSLPAERVVGLIYRAIFIASLFVIIHRYSRLAAILGIAFAWWILAPWGAMAYAWIAGMGLGLASLAILTGDIEHPSNRRLFAGALSAGLALSFRPDLIVALGVGAGLLGLSHRKRWRPLFAGLATGLIPYLVLLATAGFGNVIRNLITDPLIHLRDGRALPFPPSWSWNAEFFSRVQQYIDAMTHRNWFGAPLVIQIAMLFWILVVVALLVGFSIWRVRKSDRALLAIGLFALLLATNIYQRADISHLRLVGSLWLGLTPLALYIAVRHWFAASNRSMIVGSGVLSILLILAAPEIMVTAMYGLSTHHSPFSRNPMSLTWHGRTVITSSTEEFVEMKAALELIGTTTKPGDRLIQGPSDFRFTNYNEPAYYWLNPDLVPGTYFLEMNPGITNAPGSRMASDIESADVLLLSNRFEKFSEPNTSTVPGDSAANEAVATNFCVAVATKWYYLLRHTSQPVIPANAAQLSSTVAVGSNHLFPCGRGGTSIRG